MMCVHYSQCEQMRFAEGDLIAIGGVLTIIGYCWKQMSDIIIDIYNFN